MTKERLEELIKQGVTIYCLYKGCNVLELDLSSGDFEIAKDCPVLIERLEDGVLYSYRFDRLFETKERCEWFNRIRRIRLERFEPPMWEDISGLFKYRFIYANEFAYLLVNKKYDFIAISNSLKILFEQPATKENYEKACEIVGDLFVKGGAQ